MPLPYLLNLAGGAVLNKRRQGKAGAGLDEMIRNLLAQVGPAPSGAQQQEQQRQLDPLMQMLGGTAPNPAMSPIGTGLPDPQTQKMIDRARSIQTGKSNVDAFDYLQQATDPATYDERMLTTQKREAGALSAEQAQARHQAHLNMVNSLSGDPNLPAALSTPGAGDALGAMTSNTAGTTYLDAMNPLSGRTGGGVSNVSPNQFTPDSIKAFMDSGARGGRDYSLLEKAPTTTVIGGITYDRNPITGELQTPPGVDQLSNIVATEDAQKTGAANATLFTKLDMDRIPRLNSIKNLSDIRASIEADETQTGMIEGRVALPTEIRELIFSEQMKAARAALSAAGETRTTDADVEQMRQAMFGTERTEDFNIRQLNQMIELNDDNERKYQQLLNYRQGANLPTPTAAPPPAPGTRVYVPGKGFVDP